MRNEAGIIGAALAAAINGARTLVLEARSQFGGTATAAMWMEWNVIFKDDEEYGEDNFEKLLVAERNNDLGGLFDKLQGELREFRGDTPIGDDVTMLVLRRHPA